MAKIPDKVEHIKEEFTLDLKKAFGDELVSIVLYGSAARGQYIKGKSDINFMIVLTGKGMEKLDTIIDTIKNWRKKKVAMPLFFTKFYVLHSLDSFPLEFLNIKAHYQLIYGEDILKDITINKNDLRLQLERELKGKLLKLRQYYLETRGKKRRLLQLISDSVSTFTSIFRGLLFYRGIGIPSNDNEVITRTCDEFSQIETEFFKNLLAVKRGELKPSTEQARGMVETYIHQIADLVDMIDKINN
ncbi:nucleotidyltransferase domain-containing protein [bacterium]|nr:nucleotidyltransferase domain-containing protein [bacterium]